MNTLSPQSSVETPEIRIKWLIPAILIAVVLISAPFLPSIMKNLKSSVITGQTINATNGSVTNMQQNVDETGGSFDVAFNTAGPSSIEVMINGVTATVPVTVEEAPAVVAAATPQAGGGQTAAEGPATPSQEMVIGGGGGGFVPTREPEPEAEEEGEIHAAAELPESPFEDVTDDTLYRDSILTVNELGLMTGTDAPIGLVFNPVSDIDRAQFATVMNRLSNRFPELTELQEDLTEEDCTFPDFELEKWYIEPVTQACLKALVEGHPDDTFRPIEFINYAEAIAVAIRAASRYSDEVAVELDRQKSIRFEGKGQWYDAYVDTALTLGIVTGEAWKEVEERNPWGNASRGWIADLLAHLPELQ